MMIVIWHCIFLYIVVVVGAISGVVVNDDGDIVLEVVVVVVVDDDHACSCNCYIFVIGVISVVVDDQHTYLVDVSVCLISFLWYQCCCWWWWRWSWWCWWSFLVYTPYDCPSNIVSLFINLCFATIISPQNQVVPFPSTSATVYLIKYFLLTERHKTQLMLFKFSFIIFSFLIFTPWFCCGLFSTGVDLLYMWAI